MLAQCVSVQEIANEVKLFVIKFLDKNPLEDVPEPGQYVTVAYPDLNGIVKRRNYSILSYDSCAQTISIAVKKLSVYGVSASLHESLFSKGVVNIDGVGGDVTYNRIKGKQSVLLLSAGIGATLPMAIIRSLSEEYSLLSPNEVRYITCVRKFEDIVFLHELLRLNVLHEWLHLEIYLTNEDILIDHPIFKGGRPIIATYGQETHPDVSILCGSNQFLQDMEAMLRAAYPSSEILSESFGSDSAPAPTIQSTRISVINGPTFESKTGSSLLDILEENNVHIASKCRMGICGTCKVRVCSGTVRTDDQPGLSDGEGENGYVLACCSYLSESPLELELFSR
ncbi:flavin reductase family protein [Halomonas sp. WWR20]